MKAWISICAMVLAAGGVMVLADEPRTNAVPGTPASTGEAAVPPSAPAAAQEVKPAAVPPTTPTNSVPVQPKITTAPRTSTNAVTPPSEGSGAGHKGASTNPPSLTTTSMPAPAVASEVRPSDEGSLVPTNAVPAEAGGTMAPPPPNGTVAPPENSGIGNKGALAIGVAILVVAGGLAVFMWRRSGTAPHGSLITSAMNELKRAGKNEDKDEDKREEKHEAKLIEKPVEKKQEKKFPPPMT
jgi:hypothetical protein